MLIHSLCSITTVYYCFTAIKEMENAEINYHKIKKKLCAPLHIYVIYLTFFQYRIPDALGPQVATTEHFIKKQIFDNVRMPTIF